MYRAGFALVYDLNAGTINLYNRLASDNEHQIHHECNLQMAECRREGYHHHEIHACSAGKVVSVQSHVCRILFMASDVLDSAMHWGSQLPSGPGDCGGL